MTRLTNSIKEEILEEALNFKFSKEEAEIEKKRKELANDVYNDIYSKKTQEIMTGIPKGYLPTDVDCYVQFCNEYTRVFWGDRRLIAYKHCNTNAVKVYNETHKLTLKFLAIKEEYRDWRHRRSNARLSISTILNSVSTVKKLIEVWPEGKRFIKNLEAEKVALPALPIAEVNKMLGLIPVEGAQA